MRIDGVICDLDGTIVDSEGIHMKAWNGMIQSFGHTPPGKEWHDACIGLPDSVARDSSISLFPDLAEHKDLLIETKERIFRTMVAEMGTELAFPGVAAKFSALREAGVRLAVGTNSRRLNCEASLSASELASFFPIVVTIDQVERGKPEPDIYAEAAKRLGLAPEHCVVLEDSVTGLQAGKAAGCVVAAIANTWPRDKLEPYDLFFANTCEALDWVLKQQREERK